MDSEAKRFSGCNEGWEAYFNYWKSHKQTQIGVNFWGKIVFMHSIPIAVISLAHTEAKIIVSEFIAAPSYRGRGLGTQILQELLSHGTEILGFTIHTARAVIFPSNIASQKAFEKAGFEFESAHPDGDAWYYIYPCETV